jgi:hypothetical protein
MSWLAMVNDWGLGQLSLLGDIQDLNMQATGTGMGQGGRGGAGQSWLHSCHTLMVGHVNDWCAPAHALRKLASLAELQGAE